MPKNHIMLSIGVPSLFLFDMFVVSFISSLVFAILLSSQRRGRCALLVDF